MWDSETPAKLTDPDKEVSLHMNRKGAVLMQIAAQGSSE